LLHLILRNPSRIFSSNFNLELTIKKHQSTEAIQYVNLTRTPRDDTFVLKHIAAYGYTLA